MLFCGPIDFRSKFILRPDWNACYFAAYFRSKFILRFDFLDITVRHEIGKRYIKIPENLWFST